MIGAVLPAGAGRFRSGTIPSASSAPVLPSSEPLPLSWTSLFRAHTARSVSSLMANCKQSINFSQNHLKSAVLLV